ncbi:MAG: tRNA guanosine(34) transglycosylase Tgt [Chloroflexi bacterium]|nr:tRNA guanosine(34) transglycosylase Tgt [Chloroflexota bacterium]
MTSANGLFTIESACPHTRARAGVLHTPHGAVPTPAFMPVATQGAVKALDPVDLKSIGARIILSNTYHLYLRPGVEVIERLGGLHRFMAWDGPVLTDSGGFQVFSMGGLRKVTEEGVIFRSHIDGAEHELTPEKAIEMQERLGADVVMPLDVCPAYGDDFSAIRDAAERTLRWAERSVKAWRSGGPGSQALFGIVQGGTFAELRRASGERTVAMGFVGYAIGGLSVGEPKAMTWEALGAVEPLLPVGRPRYLMGVGSPEDLVEGVARGMDLFDCALPTRVARHGALFTAEGRVNVLRAPFRDRKGPVDPTCGCYVCRTFSAAYLYHLFKAEELLAYRLATIHNVRFVLGLMESLRRAIVEGRFPAFRQAFQARYQPSDEVTRVAQKAKWLRAREARGLDDGPLHRGARV